MSTNFLTLRKSVRVKGREKRRIGSEKVRALAQSAVCWAPGLFTEAFVSHRKQQSRLFKNWQMMLSYQYKNNFEEQTS